MGRILPRVRFGAALAVGIALSAPLSAQAFDPELEAKNFAKINERNEHIVLTPEFQARLTEQSAQDNVDLAEIQAAELNADVADRRDFSGNICFQRKQQCAGDVRFYDWDGTAGTRTPVLYTARSGATISGNVWASEAGPAVRPAVVITSGSVQAPETLYWGLAATLASHGYVVMTYDTQGQSRSDTQGEGVDQSENVPAQQPSNFVDGTEEALDFMLSTPAEPYEPRVSCTTGTSHADKQERRLAAGLNAGFNPFWELVDPDRVGVAGQSLGAAAVSFAGQKDPRVDAIVAWDNLRGPEKLSDCASAPASREDATITKPALGVSNDYGITQTPFTSDPDPQAKTAAFLDYRAADVDSMQVNIRGGTHFEAAFIPGSFTPLPLGAATLRGNDLAAWYTAAWFDKYVKCPGAANPQACEESADARLLSDRWRDDAPSAAVDQNSDPNVFSFYFRSRFDFTLADDSNAVCDDMRTGCANMQPDGEPVPYSFVADAYDPRGEPPGGTSCTLPQQGTDGRDTPRTLPPTESGDAIRGGKGPDRLRGAGGDDCIYGQKGRDRLRGNDGDDLVSGGAGRDRVKGGAGADELKCGQGRRDVAKADGNDTVGASCERVRGI
ncbi:MAG: calcium-binding protein [Solirubrobacterales bacterium]